MLLLLPALLILSYFSLPHSSDTIPRRTATTSKPSEHEPNTDLDHDGLPDSVELRTFKERENFRRWFTWIAELQFYHLSDQWNLEQRDFAGECTTIGWSITLALRQTMPQA